MSNGFSSLGAVAAELYDTGDGTREGMLRVMDRWSSSGSWVELGFFPAGEKLELSIGVDQGNADAVELTALLLEAIEQLDMAETLRSRFGKLAERAEVREHADRKADAAADAARQAFLAATVKQREALDDALDYIEREYKETTGEVLLRSRSVDIGFGRNPQPF